MSKVLFEDEDNPNCAETYATFQLVGDELIPEEVTAALRILPSASAKKGNPNPLLHSRPAILSRTGYWGLSSQGRVQSKSLEAHLVFLLDQLERAHSPIAQLCASQTLRASFLCYWMSETGYGGPMLSPGVLERIAALGADLDFDLYFSGD